MNKKNFPQFFILLEKYQISKVVNLIILRLMGGVVVGPAARFSHRLTPSYIHPPSPCPKFKSPQPQKSRVLNLPLPPHFHHSAYLTYPPKLQSFSSRPPIRSFRLVSLTSRFALVACRGIFGSGFRHDGLRLDLSSVSRSIQLHMEMEAGKCNGSVKLEESPSEVLITYKRRRRGGSTADAAKVW